MSASIPWPGFDDKASLKPCMYDLYGGINPHTHYRTNPTVSFSSAVGTQSREQRRGVLQADFVG